MDECTFVETIDRRKNYEWKNYQGKLCSRKLSKHVIAFDYIDKVLIA